MGSISSGCAFKLPKPDRRGIPNIGNTGYINSVIQVLASTRNFRRVLEWTTRDELVSLRNIIDNLYACSNNLEAEVKFFRDNISKFYPTVMPIQLEWTSQSGAKDLLVIILSIIDESMIKNPFNIHYQKRYIGDAGHSWVEEENLNLIIIPGEIKYGIIIYLQEINKTARFQGKNKLFCAACNDNIDITVEKYIVTAQNLWFFTFQEMRENQIKLLA